MEPLDASPHGDGLGGRGCWRAPKRVDEAPELQGHVHLGGRAEDDGGAAQDGHLTTVGRWGGAQWRMGWGMWRHINRGAILYWNTLKGTHYGKLTF